MILTKIVGVMLRYIADGATVRDFLRPTESASDWEPVFPDEAKLYFQHALMQVPLTYHDRSRLYGSS